jgi:hypothetical protein
MSQKGNIRAKCELDSNTSFSTKIGRSPLMRIGLVILSALAVLTLGSSAEAAGPRRIGAYNKHAAIAAYGRAVYPKYYWGFHSRTLQNVGVPHGDIGIRGSDLSMGPW